MEMVLSLEMELKFSRLRCFNLMRYRKFKNCGILYEMEYEQNIKKFVFIKEYSKL